MQFRFGAQTSPVRDAFSGEARIFHLCKLRKFSFTAQNMKFLWRTMWQFWEKCLSWKALVVGETIKSITQSTAVSILRSRSRSEPSDSEAISCIAQVGWTTQRPLKCTAMYMTAGSSHLQASQCAQGHVKQRQLCLHSTCQEAGDGAGQGIIQLGGTSERPYENTGGTITLWTGFSGSHASFFVLFAI